MNEKYDITLFFPVYNDEKTIRIVTEKAVKFLEDVSGNYEIIIIDDDSPDNSGKIADLLSHEYKNVRVIHHEKNMGYGFSLKSGFAAAKYEIICFTDGDDEYDINDFYHLLELVNYYDLIVTFRYQRLYSGYRIFISKFYNILIRKLFQTKYRDISTGLRLVKKSSIQKIKLQSDSPFIGAELTIKLMLKGYRIGEVGIQTFPREFNKGASVSIKNIISTIKDLRLVYKTIFSKNYNLPNNRNTR